MASVYFSSASSAGDDEKDGEVKLIYRLWSHCLPVCVGVYACVCECVCVCRNKCTWWRRECPWLPLYADGCRPAPFSSPPLFMDISSSPLTTHRHTHIYSLLQNPSKCRLYAISIYRLVSSIIVSVCVCVCTLPTVCVCVCTSTPSLERRRVPGPFAGSPQGTVSAGAARVI